MLVKKTIGDYLHADVRELIGLKVKPQSKEDRENRRVNFIFGVTMVGGITAHLATAVVAREYVAPSSLFVAPVYEKVLRLNDVISNFDVEMVANNPELAKQVSEISRLKKTYIDSHQYQLETQNLALRDEMHYNMKGIQAGGLALSTALTLLAAFGSFYATRRRDGTSNVSSQPVSQQL